MSQPVVQSEEAIDMYEVLKELKAVEKRDGTLGFRAEKTKEYITDARQLTDKRVKEIREGIVALEVPRMKSEHIAKIIDVMPVSLDDLKNLISSFNITVKDDYLKKMVDILKE
jgi:DNA-directed RNA polymerase subunit F